MSLRNFDDAAIAKIGISLIDNTSLNLDDDINKINKLAEGSCETAAICIYSKFIKHVKKNYSNLKIATVVNFPSGKNSLKEIIKETKEALIDGADEIDLVINYKKIIIERNTNEAEILVKNIRDICPENIILKVIIESGELNDPILIAMTTQAAIRGGADFIKTSTGKVPINATIIATAIILSTIKSWLENNPKWKNLGFKAAGGVKTVQQVREYLQLTEIIMGHDWINKNNLRFGASSLTQVLEKASIN